MTSSADADPVRARRASLARWVKIGQRTGYLLMLVSVVAFFVGFNRGFDQAMVTLIEVCIVVSSILLVPTIILGHGIRAAEKEERGQPGH